MLNSMNRASVYNAKLWISTKFDETLAASKLAYPDGTRGQDAIPISIRPAAFGAATFEMKIENGKPHYYNIQCLGGEVPGEQTVPRAEAWGATVLLTRIHYNAVARLVIDAAYVTGGMTKRLRLEK